MFERYVLGVQSHRTSGGVTRCLGDDILGSALVHRPLSLQTLQQWIVKGKKKVPEIKMSNYYLPAVNQCLG